MPPRSLFGLLFGTAAVLWGLLLGVLIVLIASGESAPSIGFWGGLAMMAASGAGWGALLGPRIARSLSPSGKYASVMHSGLAGVGVLLLAGVTALAGGLLLVALLSSAGDAAALLHRAWAHPVALAEPVGGVVFIGAPIGAAAGLVLHALAVPPASPGRTKGSRRDASS